MAGLVSLDWKTVLALGATGLVVYEVLKGDVADVAEAVDPTDPDNVINRKTEDAFKAVTGSDKGPGAALYDWLHPETQKKCFTKVKLPNGRYKAVWHQCGEGPDMSGLPPGTKEVG